MIDDYLMLLILRDSVRVFEKYPDNTRMKAEQIQLLIKRANEWLHPSIKHAKEGEMKTNVESVNVIDLDKNGKQILLVNGITYREREYLMQELNDWLAGPDPFFVISLHDGSEVKLVKVESVQGIRLL